METRKTTCAIMLQRHYGTSVLHRIVTGDEKCTYWLARKAVADFLNESNYIFIKTKNEL